MGPNHLHQKRLMITLQQVLFCGDTHTSHKKFGLPLIVQSSQENLLQKSDLMRSFQQILICRYSNAYQKTWCFCIQCIVCTIKHRHLMKKTRIWWSPCNSSSFAEMKMHSTKDWSFLIVQLCKENLMQQRHLMLTLQELRYGCIGQKIGLFFLLTLVCTIKGRTLTQKRDFNDHLAAAPIFSERYNCTPEKLVFHWLYNEAQKTWCNKEIWHSPCGSSSFCRDKNASPKKIVFFLFLKTPGRSIMLGYFCTINDYDNAVASSFQVSAGAGHTFLLQPLKKSLFVPFCKACCSWVLRASSLKTLFVPFCKACVFLSAESQLSQDHKQCSIGAATCDSNFAGNGVTICVSSEEWLNDYLAAAYQISLFKVITIRLSEEQLNDHLAADYISLFKVITIWPSEEWFNDHPAAD